MKEIEEVKIEYKKSFVAFLDVLGFKEMIKKDDREKLNTYFTEVKDALKILKQSVIDMEYIVISDSVIITIPYEESNKLKNLTDLCNAIALLQFFLASEDIFIRGAISLGDTYFNENQIVGQGYNNAYSLEQEAIYPRVILDNKIINELDCKNANLCIEKVNEESIKGFLINTTVHKRTVLYKWNNKENFSQDLPLFIDYFQYQAGEEYIELVLENIKKSIYINNSVYKKFKWVSNYLLSFIENSNDEKLKKYLDEIRNL